MLLLYTKKGGTINVDSLDNVLRDTEVTFIKMDIEGAELQALMGAKQIIKKYKPQLAISIYHKPQDIFELPMYVKSLVPEYKLYLRHYSYHYVDTVLQINIII
ncbi:MAG: FkbM family methyltransferase [Epulopiscium sp. Nuni2H_MBin001]|nr:MAG: FkbM family methyltransferase [Epulopiscium sp. Nuni2H_MBin001]